MQTYAAIDLHSNNGVVAVIDDNDKGLRQKKIQCLERAVLKKARLRSEFEPRPPAGEPRVLCIFQLDTRSFDRCRFWDAWRVRGHVV